MHLLMIRLCLVVAILFGLQDAQLSVGSVCHITDRLTKDCVVDSYDELDYGIQKDGLQLPSGYLLNDEDSQRLENSRSGRTYSSGGGKPGRLSNHWEAHCISCFIYLPCLFFLRASLWVRRRGASPRYYFVIALRRILC